MGPKSSSVPGQSHLSNPHVPQATGSASNNTPNATQNPNTLLPHNFSPFLIQHVVQAPVILPHNLIKSQVPLIPTSIAPQVLTLIKPQGNPVYSSPGHPLPCPTAPKFTFNGNPDLNLWYFLQNTLPNANEVTKSAAVFNNFQPTLPSSTVNPASSHVISQWTPPQKVNSNHEATCSNQVNPFSTATNIDPPFVPPINPAMCGHTAPAQLCWGSQQHPTPPATASEYGNLIEALADAITSQKNDPLLELKYPLPRGPSVLN